MVRTFFKKFSTTVYELGPKVDVKKLAEEQVSYFRLLKLQSLQQVIEAPEGEVVAVSHSAPSQFDIIMMKIDERFDTLNIKIESQNVQIKSLQSDVKNLQIVPYVLQICETVKWIEKGLIKKFLPLFYATSSKHNKTFKFLEDKLEIDTSGEIGKFFNIPIVARLNKMLDTGEYKKILNYRNNFAHEEIKRSQIFIERWADVMDHFKNTEKNFDPHAIKIKDLKNIHDYAHEIDIKQEID